MSLPGNHSNINEHDFFLLDQIDFLSSLKFQAPFYVELYFISEILLTIQAGGGGAIFARGP